MPDVIVKSRYFTSKKHIVNYLNYIATREGVEMLPDDIKNNKATVKQRQFISQNKNKLINVKEYKEYLSSPSVLNASRVITVLANSEYNAEEEYKSYAYKANNISPEIRDNPATQKQKDWIKEHGKGLTDLLEYSDYKNNPTFGNASELISAIAEYHITDSETYLKYIAERPGVYKQKGAAHGLFDMNGKADKKAELEKIKASESVIWSHIISLRREDAKRLGFENADSWRKAVAANAPKIAKLYNIDMKSLNILGAFHNEGHHPHVHLIVYSNDSKEGVIPKSR